MIKKVIILFLVATSGVFFASGCLKTDRGDLKNSYLFDQPKQFSNFELETSKGAFTQENLKEKLTLIFFGFTSCPDVCPLELSQLANALEGLSVDEKKLVQGVFVSVDPKRDALEKLTDYVNFFSEDLIGGRVDSPAKLLSITSQLGSYFEIIPTKENSLENKKADKLINYTIDHTTSLIIINPNSLYAGISPSPHDVSNLTEDIKTLIKIYF